MVGPDPGNLPLAWCRNYLYSLCTISLSLQRDSASSCGPIKVPRSAGSWQTPTEHRLGRKTGFGLSPMLKFFPFKVFFQPIRNHFGRRAGKNGLGSGCQHFQGSEVLGPQIVPQSRLCPLQVFIKGVSRENTASLSRKQQPEQFIFDFHNFNKSLGEEHKQVLLKIKNPRGED